MMYVASVVSASEKFEELATRVSGGAANRSQPQSAPAWTRLHSLVDVFSGSETSLSLTHRRLTGGRPPRGLHSPPPHGPAPVRPDVPGPERTKFAASINNNSFVRPWSRSSTRTTRPRYAGVFMTNFPTTTTHPFNSTGTPPNNTARASRAPRATPCTCTYGFNFFVVGQGFGNYDAVNSPAKYNPVERNTVSVPTAGWVAVRFLADNPGVWLIHCHFDVQYFSWGHVHGVAGQRRPAAESEDVATTVRSS
ncbi:hypothetical protein ABZP36_025236 [Zizania latifolia]